MVKNDWIVNKIYVLAAGIIPFVVWLPILFAGFLNDDFQMLASRIPTTLLECFLPFVESDVSQVYWRPVANTFHLLLLYIFGFEPLFFRIAGLLLYSLLMVFSFRFLISIGINNFPALLSVLFFSLLPSHNIIVGWIAGRGDILISLFIVLSFHFYIQAVEKHSCKYYLFSALFFLIAVMTKEHSFAAILLPLAYHLLYRRNGYKKMLISIGVAFGIIAIVLLYRITLIGGSPFASGNFEAVGFTNILKNFALYIPLIFSTPEFLEHIQFSIQDNPFIIFLIIALLFAIIFFSAKVFRKTGDSEKKLIKLGLVWFLVLIIPALPLLMRWYVFLPSLGILFIMSPLLQCELKVIKFKALIAAIAISVIIFIPINFENAGKWETASKTVHSALSSLSSLPDLPADTCVFWAVPDKIERVNAMKNGFQQAVQFALKNNTLIAHSPIRFEGSENAIITLEKSSDNIVLLYAEGGRFLPVGSKSRSVYVNESIKGEYYGMYYKITNRFQKYSPSAFAEIILTDKSKYYTHYFFNGKKFVKFE